MLGSKGSVSKLFIFYLFLAMTIETIYRDQTFKTSIAVLALKNPVSVELYYHNKQQYRKQFMI